MANKSTDISKFFIAGINYKKTDAAIRGRFAISAEQYEKILTLAPAHHLHELFILSTCNRTEIYGFAEEPAHLINLLCTQTTGDPATFSKIAYIKNGLEAVEHLFQVSAGLDSQILGDYEIVGQIKTAVKFARERGFIGAFTERLVNCVLQSSKSIKNQTALSGGTVSVSFAAIQYIKERIGRVEGEKILLIGVGKIGRNTCRNMVDYLGTRNITLINRTEERAASLASEMGLSYAPLEDAAKYIGESDIILVATNAEQPTLLRTHLEGKGAKLLIDLSIPCNIEKSAGELPGITLVNVDELSKLKDETLQKREAEVPKAKAIIAEHIDELLEWHDMRKYVPVLKAVKTKLKELHSCPVFSRLSGESFPSTVHTDEQIQRVINGMATKMRQHNKGGCHYIEAINEYIAIGPQWTATSAKAVG
ncbi:glutamyl-tRNA reductase [Flavitalea sp. BT771]|uniref:glutamyl-tRNA reductase n=1 Tax=Flavitalea sp. BT771 TaxID=3063329 RepID=UPI0026E48CFA|nr:glutamyl-tRNA reductase [Flavitalea sp. BT771]MDO6433805.1 glutamyl-tRNA reductase [Flavitalea sp. BT771]MDV6222290.1 glutamyl-tRNA reductase [Flavitalea sp. BT771]